MQNEILGHSKAKLPRAVLLTHREGTAELLVTAHCSADQEHFTDELPRDSDSSNNKYQLQFGKMHLSHNNIYSQDNSEL